jgi:hypothetical protein
MTRLTLLHLLLAVALAGCATGQSPSPAASGTAEPSSGVGTSPIASAAPGSSTGDPVSALIDALQAAGASVTELGAFSPDPLPGRGARLCVSGQQVSVYVYETPEEREDVASRIDPTDPSNVGTAIIEWAGKPTFWQQDRFIVLYLGSDPTVTAGLTSVLGEPFAVGQGRDPGPARHAC